MMQNPRIFFDKSLLLDEIALSNAEQCSDNICYLLCDLEKSNTVRYKGIVKKLPFQMINLFRTNFIICYNYLNITPIIL